MGPRGTGEDVLVEAYLIQEFVAAKGSEGGEPLDPKARYGVVCSAQSSGGWSMNDSARVEGTPPAEG